MENSLKTSLKWIWLDLLINEGGGWSVFNTVNVESLQLISFIGATTTLQKNRIFDMFIVNILIWKELYDANEP